MSVDTKLYLAVPSYNKNALILPILRATMRAVSGMFPPDRLRGLELIRRKREGVKPGDPVYTAPEITPFLDDELVNFSLNFLYHGEGRSLKVFFACDCDCVRYTGGPGVVFSLGAWGAAVPLLEAVAREVTQFGGAWLIENDCEDNPVPRVFEARAVPPDAMAVLTGTPYYVAPEGLAQTGERVACESDRRLYVL